MQGRTRKVILAALTAGLILALAGPSVAEQVYCNSDVDGCGTLNDEGIHHGKASDSARTFTINDKRRGGVEVILNRETHHALGWTTDQSWFGGSPSDNAAREKASGSFTCGGKAYKFYTRNYIGGKQFLELTTVQFTCK